MIDQDKSHPSISHIQKTRMRYRGPIESVKINNFQKALHKDIMKLSSDLAVSKNYLAQYFNEILEGSSKKIEITNGTNLYVCEDNIPIHQMLSDNMTRMEFLDDTDTNIWEL